MKETELQLHTPLTDAIQTIYDALVNTKMSAHTKEDVLKGLTDPLNHVMEQLDLTKDEAWLFSVMLMSHVNSYSDLDPTEITRIIGCDNLFSLELTPVLFSLVDKGLLMSNYHTTWGVYKYDRTLLKVTYWPAERTMNKVILGDEAPELRPMNEAELLECVHEMGRQMSKWRIMHKQFYSELERLLKANQHMPFIGVLNGLEMTMEDKAAILLLMQAQLNGRGISLEDLPRMVHSSIRERVKYTMSLRGRTSKVIRERYGLLANENMFEDVMIYLDAEGKELLRMIDPEFNNALDVVFTATDELKVIQPESIRPVDLLFGPELTKEYERMTALCTDANFKAIRQRMKDKHMRGGLTVLLTGAPGTGKTEMVKQMARHNGLPLLQVEMSALKGKYVGESERSIRAVFLHYARIAERHHCSPILLLNEADAVIGKRMADLGQSNPTIVQMLNTMQNILLQELEDFEGILVATTNMPELFDSAFSRRFLHKLHVSMPDQHTRELLWAKRFPTFTPSELRQLASHVLSGAEIDNIAIRLTHREILEGIDPTAQHALQLIDSETGTPQGRVVGFKMSV